ncbi:MAG: hypothetical protein ACFFAE_08665 [Candidatus Hodarchaeota archaeon]
MIANSLKAKPVVFVGKYQDIVEQLLREFTDLLKPKVVWLEYRVIPVLDIMSTLRNHPHLSGQLYFLEISTLEALEQLLKSNVLFTIVNHGFSTVIIDMPRYCSLPHNFCIRFQELMKTVKIILIMEEIMLPHTQINLVRVDSEK